MLRDFVMLVTYTISSVLGLLPIAVLNVCMQRTHACLLLDSKSYINFANIMGLSYENVQVLTVCLGVMSRREKDFYFASYFGGFYVFTWAVCVCSGCDISLEESFFYGFFSHLYQAFRRQIRS